MTEFEEGTISAGMRYQYIGNGVFSIKVFGLINAVIVSENKISVIFKNILSSPYEVSESNKENLPILTNDMSPYGFDLVSSDDDKPIKFFERVEVVVLNEVC